MPKNYNVMDELRKQAGPRGMQKKFAQRAGCSQGFLSDVMRGHRQPSEAIISALGLEKIVTYRKKRKSGND